MSFCQERKTSRFIKQGTCVGWRLAVIINILFPLSVPSLPFSSPSSGYGSYQHALCAPHGGLWGLLHCSAHPAANLRCLLEVHTNTYLMVSCLSLCSLVPCVPCPLCTQCGYFSLFRLLPIHKKSSLCVSSAVPKLQWGLIRNKWFNYSRGVVISFW